MVGLDSERDQLFISAIEKIMKQAQWGFSEHFYRCQENSKYFAEPDFLQAECL